MKIISGNNKHLNFQTRLRMAINLVKEAEKLISDYKWNPTRRILNLKEYRETVLESILDNKK